MMTRVPRKKISEMKTLIVENQSKKYVHYRDIVKDIEVYNYHISTKVDFKKVKHGPDAKVHWGALRGINKIKHEYESSTGSKYFINEDDEVYRLSNHWGAVASCEWTLDGEGELMCSVFVTGPWEIGVANLSDFKLFLRKVLPKRDYRLNPEWKEKFSGLKQLRDELFEIMREEEFDSRPVIQKIFAGRSLGMFSKELKSAKDGIKLKQRYAT